MQCEYKYQTANRRLRGGIIEKAIWKIRHMGRTYPQCLDEFRLWMLRVVGYVNVLFPGARQVLEKVIEEEKDTRIDEKWKMQYLAEDAINFEAANKLDEQLYVLLINVVEGEGLVVMGGNGVPDQAWMPGKGCTSGSIRSPPEGKGMTKAPEA